MKKVYVVEKDLKLTKKWTFRIQEIDYLRKIVFCDSENWNLVFKKKQCQKLQ